MKLTAVLESWVIPDGSYPPFTVGMPVNLSFEVSTRELAIHLGNEDEFESRDDGECSFAGRVLNTYDDDPDQPLAVVEAAGFRFFLEGERARPLSAGDRIRGAGTLTVDYYIWVENVDERAEPPDLFFDLVVRRIRCVTIPEAFIHRQPTAKSLPARVAPSDFGTVVDLETMVGQNFDEEFYLVDLETFDQPVARTFLE